MSTLKRPDPLRDPGFLLWLGRFTGDWETPRGVVEVDRRPDGWLTAHVARSSDRASLATTLRTGTWKKAPPSPLGFYPVVLSASLVSLWLTPMDAEKIQRCGGMGSALRHYVEKIEARIAQLPTADCDRRWLLWWSSQSLPPLRPAVRRTHHQLLARFRSE